MAYGVDLLLWIKVDLGALLQRICRPSSIQFYVKLFVPRPVVLWYAYTTKTGLMIRVAGQPATLF